MANSGDAQKVDDCVNNCCYAYPFGSVAENRARGFFAVLVFLLSCSWFLRCARGFSKPRTGQTRF